MVDVDEGGVGTLVGNMPISASESSGKISNSQHTDLLLAAHCSIVN
jgi:hypothetical protein